MQAADAVNRDHASRWTKRRRLPVQSRGMLLPEALVSVGLALPVVLYAIHLLCSSINEQALAEQRWVLEQDAQFALEVITRAIEQAGHPNVLTTLSAAAASSQTAVNGWDDATMAATSDPLTGLVKSGALGSDVLMTHFSAAQPAPGSAAEVTGIFNCAGMAVVEQLPGDPDLGYSVFYVARGAGGEPELRCKYRTILGWDSEPLVAGVEALQLLYGVDHDGDAHPDQFMNASAIHSMPALWKQVVALKVALMMRGARNLWQHSPSASWHLLGETYSMANGLRDKGVHVSVTDFPVSERSRLRRVYEQIVFLRNYPSSSSASKVLRGS